MTERVQTRTTHAKELWLTLPVTEWTLLLGLAGTTAGKPRSRAPRRGLTPARVAVQHRGAYDLATEEGEVRASAAIRARARRRPARRRRLGRARPRHGADRGRAAAAYVDLAQGGLAGVREQVLAANVDVAFLVQALPLDFNLRRLERYLAMAWESGAQPVVLLTKTDLVDDVAPFLVEVETATLGACPVEASRRSPGSASTSCSRTSRATAPPCCSARRASASRRS
jgi:hypothetical protein